MTLTMTTTATAAAAAAAAAAASIITTFGYQEVMVPSLGLQMGFRKRGPWYRPKCMILQGLTNPKIIRVEGALLWGRVL